MDQTHAVETQHPEYCLQVPMWNQNCIALGGQDCVKQTADLYLPPTSGMLQWRETQNNDNLYLAYLLRARFSDIPLESLEGALGVLFGKDPAGSIDEIVTRDKLSVLALARQVTSAVYTKGRHVLVIDAGADRMPYITQYAATAMINWQTNEEGMLTLAVFKETICKPDRDEFSHAMEDQFRVYTPGLVRVFDKSGAVIEEYNIAGPELPVIVIGAVDCSAICDRAPITRIVECALAAYRNSADYQQAMFLTAQPTAYSAGLTEEQFIKNNQRGQGAGAHWYLGETTEGRVGYLEFSGTGVEKLKEAQDAELAMAADYAVKLAHINGVEAANAMELRDTAQKSALSMMADSVAEGINAALDMLHTRTVSPRNFEPFEFNMQSQTEAEATMITAIGNRVNMGGMPPIVEYNYALRSGLFSGTYEEWLDEINTGGHAMVSPLDNEGDNNDLDDEMDDPDDDDSQQAAA